MGVKQREFTRFEFIDCCMNVVANVVKTKS